MADLLESAEYKNLKERDQKTVTPAVFRYTPLAFQRGEGVHLIDIQGDRYLDFAAGMATLPLGHCYPTVVAAIKDQADKIHHLFNHIGLYPPYVELVETLQSMMPAELSDGMALFMNSGSEAVESALKAARYVTGRPAVISFMGAFHGRSLGALSVTSSKAGYRKGHSGLLPGVYYAPYPAVPRFLGDTDAPEAALSATKAFMESLLAGMVPPDDIAAILVEPMQGEGGYRVPVDGFLAYLRELADKIGCLLIADEIQTGIARSGKMFAFEHWNILPDLITMAKALGGGLPLSCVYGKSSVMKQWGPGAQGSTFGGNPIAIAASLATLRAIKEENLMENAGRVGKYLFDRLRTLADAKAVIDDVRGKGLFLALEVVDENGRPNPELAKRLTAKAGEKRLVIVNCGTAGIRFAPPLIITEAHADQAVDILAAALEELGY